MARKLDSDSQIGRRLRLRDLHLFFTVMQRGSMAKAASYLGISQPGVSEVIANLEHSLGVKLFDRSPQGVEPTIYGRALHKRGLAAFDELKQGIRDIEFLSDPTSGELRIGCGPTTAAGFMTPIIRQFSKAHPHVTLHYKEVPPPRRELGDLRDRVYDLVLGHLVTPLEREFLADDLNVEILFDDPFVVMAGSQSPWARRRKIDLSELVDAPWILSPENTQNYLGVENAFRARGLPMPKVRILTASVPVRADLLAHEPFVSAYPRSIAQRYSLKVLPVDLSAPRTFVGVVTLKNRTLSPVTERFIEHLRAFARPLRSGRQNGGGRAATARPGPAA
jgi:DNA-binding transcriptional LysR family regulator